MSNVAEKISHLLIKAGHPNTPETEARVCAKKAAELFFKYKDEVQITFFTEIKSSYVPNDNIPDISTVTKDVELFNMIISKEIGTCLSCHKSYNIGEIVAYASRKGTTHYKCRHYWTNV